MYVAGVKITEDSIVTLSHSCVSVLSYNDSQGSVVMGGKIEGEDYSSIRMDADGDNLLVVLKNHLRLYDMRDRSSLRIQTDVQVEGIIYQCKLFFPYAAVTTSHRTPQLQVWNMERGQHLRTIKNNGFVLGLTQLKSNFLNIYGSVPIYNFGPPNLLKCSKLHITRHVVNST